MRSFVTTSRVRLIARCAAGALLCLVSGACTSAPDSPRRDRGSLGEQGPGVGVELAWWVVDDTPGSDDHETGVSTRHSGHGTVPLAEALGGYLQRPVPVPESTLRAWSDNGLRIVAVPRADVDRIRNRLRLVGPIQQQWFGETPMWTEAVKGPTWAGRQSIQLDNGPLTLSGGALRMLVRCWAVPAAHAIPAPRSLAGALQVELVPQHFDGAAPDPGTALSPAPRPPREAQGLVFSRLSLESTLTGNDALIIVPETPGVDWVEPPTPTDPEVAPGHGPPIPRAPSLGEAMLTDITRQHARGTRIILVVIPSAPRNYNLFSR